MRFTNRFAKVLTAAVVVTSALAVSLIGAPSVAQAAGSTFQVLGGPGFNICSATPFTFATNENFPTTVTEMSTLTVPGVGTVFSAVYDIAAGSYNSYGITPSAYTVAPHTLITFTDSIYNGPSQTGGIAFTVTANFDCTTGALVSTSTTIGGGNKPGPQVPGGFVLKQVTCTTPINIQPSGTQTAGSAVVVAGQRWYVSPTPIKDKTGKSWTELFDGGYSDGYIPTSCVNFGYNYVYGVN